MEKDYSLLYLKNAEYAADIENAVNKIEGVECAVLNFPVRKLKVIGNFSDDILAAINSEISAIVQDAEAVPQLETIIKYFEVKNLDCAHCGAKVEEAISKLDGVDEVLLNYPLKKLKIKAVFSDELIELISKTAASVEPDVEIAPYSAKEKQRISRIKEIVKELEESEASESNETHVHKHSHECCEHDHDEHSNTENHSHSDEHEKDYKHCEEPDIVDEYKEILGDMYKVNAKVEKCNGFSAHADYNEMIEWLKEIDTSRLKKIFLIHGEKDQQEGFKQHLAEAGFDKVEIVCPDKEYKL